LDEFANLGPMDEIARAIALLRGYRATIWMFVQSLAQLEGVYPESWKTFLDVDVVQAFGTNDLFTAEHLSRLAGERTVFASGAGASNTEGGRKGRGKNTSLSERSRRLILPDEVRRLDPSRQLLFVKAQAPLHAKKLRYYADGVLASRAEPNPFYEGSSPRNGHAARPLGWMKSLGRVKSLDWVKSLGWTRPRRGERRRHDAPQATRASTSSEAEGSTPAGRSIGKGGPEGVADTTSGEAPTGGPPGSG
jgi:type IV secretion system protein VirD4